jgi:hypothetical protein
MPCDAREAILSLAKGFMAVSMSFIVPFDLEAFSLMRQGFETVESRRLFPCEKACFNFA